VDILEIASDGLTIASASAEDTPGPVAVRNLSAKTGARHLHPNESHDEIRGISFSRKGNRLAFITVDGAVAVYEFQGNRRVQKIADADPGLPFRGIAVGFSDDGKTVMGATAFGMFHAWNAETGEAVDDFDLRLENANFGLEAASFTPDGKHI